MTRVRWFTFVSWATLATSVAFAAELTVQGSAIRKVYPTWVMDEQISWNGGVSRALQSVSPLIFSDGMIFQANADLSQGKPSPVFQNVETLVVQPPQFSPARGHCTLAHENPALVGAPLSVSGAIGIQEIRIRGNHLTVFLLPVVEMGESGNLNRLDCFGADPSHEMTLESVSELTRGRLRL